MTDDDRPSGPLPRVDTQTRASNAWWQYRVDRYRAPDGTEREYHYVRTTDSVMVIPILDDRRVVLVRQYRYLDAAWGLELPGGGLGAHAGDEATAAAAELLEETGYRATTWTRMGGFSPCKGVVQETSGVWLARGLHPDPGGPRPDDVELVEPVFMTPAAIDAAILEGAISDGMTLAAWQIARAHGALT